MERKRGTAFAHARTDAATTMAHLITRAPQQANGSRKASGHGVQEQAGTLEYKSANVKQACALCLWGKNSAAPPYAKHPARSFCAG